MKLTGLCLVTLCCLTLMGQGCGSGDNNESRRDPGYSTGNYKHANKADSARKWERKAGVAVKPPTAGAANLSNYKGQAPGQAPAGGVTVEHRTSATDIADRNYKMQRPAQSTTSVGAGVAGKKKKGPAGGAATGN